MRIELHSLLLPLLLGIQAEASWFRRPTAKPFFSTKSATTHSCLTALSQLRGGADGDKIQGPCIGIDLGTTYSCVAVWRNNRVDVCPNEQGHRITPSYVAFLKDGTRLVGDAAKNQASQNPTGTFFDVSSLSVGDLKSVSVYHLKVWHILD